MAKCEFNKVALLLAFAFSEHFGKENSDFFSDYQK